MTRARTSKIVEVLHSSGIAHSVPGSNQKFSVAATEGLGEDGVVTGAVLFLVVVEVDFSRSAEGDVRAVVGGGKDGGSDDGDDGQEEGDEFHHLIFYRETWICGYFLFFC